MCVEKPSKWEHCGYKYGADTYFLFEAIVANMAAKEKMTENMLSLAIWHCDPGLPSAGHSLKSFWLSGQWHRRIFVQASCLDISLPYHFC